MPTVFKWSDPPPAFADAYVRCACGASFTAGLNDLKLPECCRVPTSAATVCPACHHDVLVDVDMPVFKWVVRKCTAGPQKPPLTPGTGRAG